MKDFIKGFIHRQGTWILGAHVFSKIIGFLTVLYIVRNHSEVEYGLLSYALVVVNALVPFMGLGAFQAFLRFGSDRPGYHSKKSLYRYAYSRGMIASFGLTGAIFLLAPLICHGLPDAVSFMRILSFSLVSVLVMEYAKSYARLLNMNRQAGQIEMSFSVSLLALSVLLSYFMGIRGYALAIVLAPMAAAIPFMVALRLPLWTWGRETGTGAFWRYGLFITAGSLTAQLFYAVDVYMIGELMREAAEEIALYRVSAIIPLAGLVLPIAIASSDFVRNSENKNDRAALLKYVKGYMRTFGVLTPLLCALLMLATPSLLGLFGGNYAESPRIMHIFLFGMAGAYLFRVPYGNLLSAVGLADRNTYTNIAVLLLTIFLCAWAIPRFGIMGAAWVTAGMMWVSGLVNFLLFFLFLRKLPEIK